MEQQLDALIRRTKLQTLLKAFCDRMKADHRFEQEMRRLWRSFSDKAAAAAIIMKTRYQQDLSRAEAEKMASWIQACFTRKPTRRQISLEEKQAMWNRQHGICPCCKQNMEPDMSQNHADHVIPYTYVGDELEHNLQLTHAGCNLSKGAALDYELRRFLFDI